MRLDDYQSSFAPVTIKTQNKKLETAFNRLFGSCALESHLRIMRLLTVGSEELCCLQDFIKAFVIDPQVCCDIAQSVYNYKACLGYEPFDFEIDKLAYPIILATAAQKSCRRGIWSCGANHNKSLLILLTLCAHIGNDGVRTALQGTSRIAANLYLLYALSLALGCEKDAKVKLKFKEAILKLKNYVMLQLKQKNLPISQEIICLASLCGLYGEYRLDMLDMDNFCSGLHMAVMQNQILGVELRFKNIKLKTRIYDMYDDYSMDIKTENGNASISYFGCGNAAIKAEINSRTIYNSSGFALKGGAKIKITAE